MRGMRTTARSMATLSAATIGVFASGLLGARPGDDAASAVADVPIPSVRLVRVWPELTCRRPTQLVARPDRENTLVLIEQSGRMLEVDAASDAPDGDAKVFLDLTDRVNFGSNEEGLLSLAFHPKFEENRRFVLYYTAKDPRRVVISEFVLDPEDAAKTAASERTILDIPQPFWNHNGGTVLFGPDGMLYASIGDGGAAADPLDHGQNLGSVLAAVVRLDIDGRADGEAYRVPADNPFVDREGARPEIWAYGLRNVWRMSFDRETGDLWAGDVGQNKYEEIDLVVKGGNYGWNRREGFHAFREGDPAPADPYLDPLVEYPRNEGVSVTGGHVYRGADEAMQGVYLYADYGFGTIWGLRRDSQGKVTGPEVVAKRRGSLISSFGEAKDGTLFITTFEGGERSGKGAVYRIDPVTRTASR